MGIQRAQPALLPQLCFSSELTRLTSGHDAGRAPGVRMPSVAAVTVAAVHVHLFVLSVLSPVRQSILKGAGVGLGLGDSSLSLTPGWAGGGH